MNAEHIVKSILLIKIKTFVSSAKYFSVEIVSNFAMIIFCLTFKSYKNGKVETDSSNVFNHYG